MELKKDDNIGIGEPIKAFAEQELEMPSNISRIGKVQQAIEIQGYITVMVDGRERQARSIKVIDGDWVTDIMTSDLCGYVRIKKTKDAMVFRAEKIIENEDKIRAAREAKKFINI